MGQISRIRKLIQEDNSQLLEDITTFTNMQIPREQLIKLGPEEYRRQRQALKFIQEETNANLLEWITDNKETLAEYIIKTLTTPQAGLYIDNGNNYLTSTTHSN